MIRRRLRALDERSRAWLVGPEPRAAGRLGLFRILYGLFYLWALTDYLPTYLAELPMEALDPVIVVRLLPSELPLVFFEALVGTLAGALVLLTLGVFTPAATLVTLVAGWLLESFLVSSGFEHSTVFMMAYIPFFMLLAGDWGATWSLDALRSRRRVDPSEASPRFVLPIRALLVVLAAFYCASGMFKLVPWTVGENVFGFHLLETNIKLAKLGKPVVPTSISPPTRRPRGSSSSSSPRQAAVSETGRPACPRVAV